MFPTVDLLVCHNDSVFHIKVVRYVGFCKSRIGTLDSGIDVALGIKSPPAPS